MCSYNMYNQKSERLYSIYVWSIKMNKCRNMCIGCMQMQTDLTSPRTLGPAQQCKGNKPVPKNQRPNVFPDKWMMLYNGGGRVGVERRMEEL